MAQCLAIELIAENDHILTISGQESLFGISRVPDPGLTHEIEPSSMNNCRPLSLRVGAEEDSGSEDSLKSSHQATVLRTALLHPECIEHLRSAFEGDLRRLLPDGKSGKENGNQPVLAPWQTVAGMSGYLQDELTVPAFVEQAALSWSLHGQTAENERARGESKVLPGALAFQPDALDRFDFPESPLGNNQLGMSPGQQRPDPLEFAAGGVSSC